jgi:hypothetical protein
MLGHGVLTANIIFAVHPMASRPVFGVQLDSVKDIIRADTKTLLEEPRAELTALHFMPHLLQHGLLDQVRRMCCPVDPACMLLVHPKQQQYGINQQHEVNVSRMCLLCEGPSQDMLLALLQAGLKRTVGNFVLSDLRRFEVPDASCWNVVHVHCAVQSCWEPSSCMSHVHADVGQRANAALPHQRAELLAPCRHDRLPVAQRLRQGAHRQRAGLPGFVDMSQPAMRQHNKGACAVNSSM